MSLEKRISALEKTMEGSEPHWIIVVEDGNEGSPHATEAKKEAAIASYKAEHPDWASASRLNVVFVPSEDSKGLLERVLAGERTQREKSRHEH